MSALEERRQRAREAFWDASAGLMSGARDGVESCIETATRVRITVEAVVAFEAQEQGRCCDCGSNTRHGLSAALRELGFEVEG